MDIPALEDKLLAYLLIFVCLYYIFVFGKGKRKGKGKGKGKGKEQENGRASPINEIMMVLCTFIILLILITFDPLWAWQKTPGIW